jgi:hypothetical protein
MGKTAFVMIRIEAYLVYHHAGTGSVFPGEKACPVGRADRVAGHGVTDIKALPAKPVDMGSLRPLVSGITQAGVTQLIRKYVN